MSKLEVTYFNNVLDIPEDSFEQLGCANTFYFSKDFLSAFAKANPNIHHRYIIIKTGEQPVALVVFQQLSVALDQASEQLSFSNKLARSLRCYLSNRKTQITVCGNVFLSGNYGVYTKPGADNAAIYKQIAKEMKPLRTREKASVFFMKDFVQSELSNVTPVENYQFQSFAVEPNMRLSLQWGDFESYKAALKSKYRVKVNKADTQSAALVAKPFDSKDIAQHAGILQQLYCNITDRALFKAVDMRMETYGLLKERFRESVLFNTYWHEDKMVGFATGFKVGDRLDAHFIGIDYNCNKQLAIYPRILNDYVRLGMELGCDEVNFGRTSSEIKSTLGAIPEGLTCYVRHRRTAANLLFKPLVRQIKMTEYKQHRPFKKV